MAQTRSWADLLPAALSPLPHILLIHGSSLKPFHAKLQATGSGEAGMEPHRLRRSQGEQGLGH